MIKIETSRLIAEMGLKLLVDEYGYKQIEVYKKLKVLGFKVSRSTISNLYTGEKKPGKSFIRILGSGIAEVLKEERCLAFNEGTKTFIRLPNCKPRSIDVEPKKEKEPDTNAPLPYVLHDGRFYVSEKIAFFEKAEVEIIELGIRLRNFKNYFNDKKESAFKDPLRAILDKGVQFKCFVLEPTGNFARRYFEDRAKVQYAEKKAFADSPEVLAELKSHFIALNREGYSGKMELHTYDHFPYYHASVIDGETESAEMLMAAYLYGVSRANTPVLKLKKRNNKKIFKRYFNSIKAMTENQSNQLV